MLAFFFSFYSFKSNSDIKLIINEFKPDLVQIQNLYPLISPSVLKTIKNMDVPIVMRLANYRLACPNGLFLSKGRICEKCGKGREYWCIIRNCENNLFKSINYALRNYFARLKRYYIDNVDIYYAQTKFQKNKLASYSLAKLSSH
jgi:hypothetical protein